MTKESNKETLKFKNLFSKNKEKKIKKRSFLMKMKMKIRRKKSLIAIIVFFIIGIALGILIFQSDLLSFKTKSKNKEKSTNPTFLDLEKSSEKSSGYQAVFLTNSQVYFGKLEKEEETYAYLTEVYYLRSKQPLQEQQEPSSTKSAEKKEKKEPTPLDQQNLTLIKLGRELHAPMDKIKINKDHILFIEDLTEDSRVVQAIKQHKGQ